MTFEWLYRIYKNSPPKLRDTKGKRLLYGGFEANILPTFVYLMATFYLPLGSLPFIMYALGLIYIINTIKNDPRLLYILTFKAHRLVIISRKSGLPIYEHAWTDKEYGHELLSSLIHSILTVSNAVLLARELDKIKLQQGIVMFNHREEYVVAIFASKPSSYLELSLNRFEKEFRKKYLNLNFDENKGISSNHFNFVGNLISNYFNSVMDWRKEKS